MSDQPRASEYTPEGYCPRCDYPAGVGTCPECGITIGAHALRSKPRGWLRRHVRGLTVGLATLGLVVWFVSGSTVLIPSMPTWYLLHVQVQDGQHAMAATEELAQRFANGGLSQNATTRFLRQALDVQWVGAGRGDRLRATLAGKLYSIRTPLPPIQCREVVQAVLVDGEEERLEQDPTWSWGHRPVQVYSGVSCGITVPSYTSPWPVYVRCPLGWRDFDVVSTMTVTDPKTGATIASWTDTHRVRMNVRPDIWLDETATEELRRERMNRPTKDEVEWGRRGKWMPPDRIGLPGKRKP